MGRRSTTARLLPRRMRAMGVAPTNGNLNCGQPTLLEAAGINSVSPAFSPAMSMNAPYAVTYRIQTAAASVHDSDAGCLATAGAGTMAVSP